MNIKIIGDLPMYVDYHSVDLWSHPHLFHLDSHTMKPTFVSGLIIQSMFSLISRLNWLGFPANDDYDIQIWNQPVYRWNEKSVENDLFTWWIRKRYRLLIFFASIIFVVLSHIMLFRWISIHKNHKHQMRIGSTHRNIHRIIFQINDLLDKFQRFSSVWKCTTITWKFNSINSRRFRRSNNGRISITWSFSILWYSNITNGFLYISR